MEVLVMITNSRKKSFNLVTLLGVMLGLMRIFWPLSLLPFDYYVSLPHKTFWEWLVLILVAGTFIYVFAKNIYLFSIGIQDLTRKDKLMTELNQMLRPRKERNYKKIIPTINFLDPTSLQSWQRMRLIVKDYGKKFTTRLNLYFPIIGFMAIMDIPATLTLILGWIDLEKSKRHLLEAMFMFDFVFFSIMLLVLLYKAAKVNSHYKSHKMSLLFLRGEIVELLNYKEHFFEYPDKEKGFPLLLHNQVFGRRVSDPLAKRLIFSINSLIGYVDPGDYLEELIQIFDTLIQDLDLEKQFYMLKIFGISVDMNVFTKILVGSLSIAFTITKFLLSTESNFLKNY